MRINDVNLGGGLYRLNVEATCPCENVNNVPTSVMDGIMRDVVNRMKNQNTSCGCSSWTRKTTPSWTPTPTWKPTPCVPNREPDGIDVHVDRPLRENFGSHWSWADAMAKYRTLEHVAKDCNWECREPMKGTPNYRNMTPTPKRIVAPKPCPCPCDNDIKGLALALLEAIL